MPGVEIMTDYQDVLRQAASERGWLIEVSQNRISVGQVPYRMKDGNTGKCQISVETLDDGLRMKSPEKGGGATHAAILSGVSDGRAYQATGEPVGNVLWTDDTNECVISIKLDDAEYVDAWHALLIYASSVAGEVGVQEREQIERVFKFEILGEDSWQMRNFRNREIGMRIGIVGLGGVGLWIFDMMSKTDVKEIRVWDGDKIEGRNLVRAPGWAGQDAIGKNKAEYFGEHYDQMRTGISIYPEYWQPDQSTNLFHDLDFVFVAIDNTETRSALCEHLEQTGVPFIDVGLGIELRQEGIRGTCQIFYSGTDPARWRVCIPTSGGEGEKEYGEDDYYDLQLADLGALTAALAVGTWRRHINQYEQEEMDWLIRYWIEQNELIKRTEQP